MLEKTWTCVTRKNVALGLKYKSALQGATKGLSKETFKNILNEFLERFLSKHSITNK